MRYFHESYLKIPELVNLKDVPQDPIHHPEGCALTHTLHVIDAMYDISLRERFCCGRTHMIMMAALCHDFGKALPENGGSTFFNEKKGKWVAYGHEKTGASLTRRFLGRFDYSDSFIKKVVCLVEEHMFTVINQKITEKNVGQLRERLRKNNVFIDDLLFLIEADNSGRPPLPKGPSKNCIELAKMWEKLFNDKPAILRGRDVS